MRTRVYVETSVVSYLVSRPSRDLVVAAHQEVTREWWETRRARFDLFVSQAVLDEAGRGDPAAAAARLRALEGIAVLDATEETAELAQSLLAEGVFPSEARLDALHVALAATHGLDVLLTWNCRHLANGEIARTAARHLWARGHVPPAICTPDELMGE